MYCPECGAEYRPSATVCSDCQVALVPNPPGNHAKVDPASDEYFVLVWSGSRPKNHLDVQEILERENIPMRTLRREDVFMVQIGRAPYEIYVPASSVKRARQVLDEKELLEEGSEEIGDIGTLEIPAEDDSHEEGAAPREPKDWHPDDAVVEIWSGADSDLANMISMSLRENQIPCRSSRGEAESDTTTQSTQRLYVLPEDEARAKEIVREIVDAVPPQ